MAQDVGLDVDDGRGGNGPDVDEATSQLITRSQHVGLAPAGVEGPHQLGAAPFPQGMLGHAGFELDYQLGVSTEPETCLDSVFDHRFPQGSPHCLYDRCAPGRTSGAPVGAGSRGSGAPFGVLRGLAGPHRLGQHAHRDRFVAQTHETKPKSSWVAPAADERTSRALLQRPILA